MWKSDYVMGASIGERRERNRNAVSRCRDRRREGRIFVSIEVPVHVLRALERLALLEPGNRDKRAVAWAVGWSLEALPGFVSMGDAVWPARLWGELSADHDADEDNDAVVEKASGRR